MVQYIKQRGSAPARQSLQFTVDSSPWGVADGRALRMLGRRRRSWRGVVGALRGERNSGVAPSTSGGVRLCERRSAGAPLRIAHGGQGTAAAAGKGGQKWWPGTESNRRHADFQSAALPTELPGQCGPNGGTTGRRFDYRQGGELRQGSSWKFMFTVHRSPFTVGRCGWFGGLHDLGAASRCPRHAKARYVAAGGRRMVHSLPCTVYSSLFTCGVAGGWRSASVGRKGRRIGLRAGRGWWRRIGHRLRLRTRHGIGRVRIRWRKTQEQRSGLQHAARQHCVIQNCFGRLCSSRLCPILLCPVPSLSGPAASIRLCSIEGCWHVPADWFQRQKHSGCVLHSHCDFSQGRLVVRCGPQERATESSLREEIAGGGPRNSPGGPDKAQFALLGWEGRPPRAGEEPGIGGFTVSLENVPATNGSGRPEGDEAVPLPYCQRSVSGCGVSGTRMVSRPLSKLHSAVCSGCPFRVTARTGAPGCTSTRIAAWWER